MTLLRITHALELCLAVMCQWGTPEIMTSSYLLVFLLLLLICFIASFYVSVPGPLTLITLSPCQFMAHGPSCGPCGAKGLGCLPLTQSPAIRPFCLSSLALSGGACVPLHALPRGCGGHYGGLAWRSVRRTRGRRPHTAHSHPVTCAWTMRGPVWGCGQVDSPCW